MVREGHKRRGNDPDAVTRFSVPLESEKNYFGLCR